MNIAESLDLLMFVVAVFFLLAGYPVAFTLGGTALLFAGIGMAFGVFDASYVAFLPQRIFGTMTNETLVAVPLFVFMGVMLERSKVAEDLLVSMGRLFGSLRGGLGISVIIVGALLAASTGIVGATVVTMGLLSLPTMLKQGYDKGLATGVINASGTLGQIIPPSIVLVLLGDVLSSAYDEAQRQMGVFSPKAVTVGDLFAGSLLPGLLLVGLYIAYVVFVAITKPQHAPAVTELTDEEGAKMSALEVFTALVPPLILIVAVLGSILGGIATPTEAAAVGAVGAIFLAGHRLCRGETGPANAFTRISIVLAALSIIAVIVLKNVFDLRLASTVRTAADMTADKVAFVLCAIIAVGLIAAIWKTLRAGGLKPVVRSTAIISSMVFIILIGAAMFSLVFRGLEGDVAVREILTNMPGGLIGAMLIVMAVMFVLGFFLDFIEITFVVVPIVAPVLLTMGVDPIWLGVMMAMNLQTSFLTPPFGFALFYLRGVAPNEVKTTDIYAGAIPFVIIQIATLALLALFPEITTWLPHTVFK
jgi:tripartite ATP-independent transporter DctM subunit